MLMLTKPESPAIPTTGNSSLLCFRTIRVPGWSGLLVFLITRGIFHGRQVEGLRHEGLRILHKPTHAFHGRSTQGLSVVGE